MRRLAHAFGRLRLTTAAVCLLLGAALATGLALLALSGGHQLPSADAGHATAVAGPVSIDRPVRPPASDALRHRANRDASRLAVARPQLSGQARPIGDSRPGHRLGARSIASRAGAPGADLRPTRRSGAATNDAASLLGADRPHSGTSEAGGSRGAAQHSEASRSHPPLSLIRTPPASVQGGQPWKPAGVPGSIRIPSNPSGSEQTLFCFIAQAGAPGCNGTPASVSVTLQAPSITANGNSTTTATITVKDSGGSVVTSQQGSITLSSAPDPSSPNATVMFGSITANADGTYSATITSGTTAGTVAITATDSSVTPAITSPAAQLVLKSPNALPAANVSVELNPNSIIANGTSTTTATATVTASDGTTPIPGDSVQFSVAGQPVGAPCATGSSGTCSVQITSTRTAGTLAITAADTSVTPNITSPAVTLTQTAGPAAKLTLTLGSNSIVADGKSTTTATATVTDANGNPIANDSVNFTAGNGAVTIGPTCTTVSNGQCTVTITSNTNTPGGTVTITATDALVSTATDHANLSLTSAIGLPCQITLTLGASQLPADGTSHTLATVTVKDPNGNLVSGSTVSITWQPVADVSVTPLAQSGPGTYTATVTSSTTAEPVKIIATDSSATGPSCNPSPISASQTLTLTSTSVAAPGAASVAVSVSPVAIFADGVSHAFATAQVDAADGTPVSGDAVQFFVNGQPFGSVSITDSSGQCHVTLASSTVVGTETITAVDNSANFLPSSNSVVLSFVPPPPSGGSTGPGTSSTPTPPRPAHHPSGPSASKIKSSLAALLGAKGASIRALLKKGSHPFSYHALTAGKLTIDWWDGPSARKPKLIASVTVTVSKAKTLTAKLTLTSTGRSALKHANQLKVKSAASFKPSGKPAVSRSATFTLH